MSESTFDPAEDDYLPFPGEEGEVVQDTDEVFSDEFEAYTLPEDDLGMIIAEEIAEEERLMHEEELARAISVADKPEATIDTATEEEK